MVGGDRGGQERPWTGFGYGAVWQHPWKPPLLNIVIGDIRSRPGTALSHGHNSAVDLVVEVGVAGVLLTVVIMVTAGMRAGALLRMSGEGGVDGTIMARLIVLCLVNLTVCGITEPMATIPLGWWALVLLTEPRERARRASTYHRRENSPSNGEPVSLRDHLLSIKRSWKLITALVVLGAVLGAVMASVMPAKYVSTTRFFVASAVSSDDPDELFDRNQIAGQRVKSYVELIQSDRMTEAVLADLGEDVAVFDADDDITALALPETVIIDVQVTGSTAEDAQMLAAAYGDVAPGVVSEVESIGTVKAAQVALTVIQAAKPGERETPSLLSGLLLGALLGLVLGAGGAVLVAAVRREAAAASATDRA